MASSIEMKDVMIAIVDKDLVDAENYLLSVINPRSLGLNILLV
jgi:hypothetical protein